MPPWIAYTLALTGWIGGRCLARRRWYLMSNDRHSLSVKLAGDARGRLMMAFVRVTTGPMLCKYRDIHRIRLLSVQSEGRVAMAVRAVHCTLGHLASYIHELYSACRLLEHIGSQARLVEGTIWSPRTYFVQQTCVYVLPP